MGNGGNGLQPDTCLVTKSIQAVRRPGTYELCECMGEVTILTAAMPRCKGQKAQVLAESLPWVETVTERIRAVLYAAKVNGLPNLVLGAFGCGAFGNPPWAVAELFKQQLQSSEFRGSFAKVVFAVIDPQKKGNLIPFNEVMYSIVQSRPHVVEVGDRCICCHSIGRLLDQVCPLCDGL